MRSIAWMSEKGGTGKTTSVVNVSVCLAKLGKRTLLVDADPQGNASFVFLGGRDPDGATLYDVLTGNADAGDTIVKTATERLELLPADTRLAEANVTLAGEVGRERRLRLAMRGIDGRYDFVMLDTGPQRTLININVLNYAAEVMCPVDPGIFSLAGLVKLQGAMAEVVRFLDNQALRLGGLVLTRCAHDNLSRDVESQLRTTFGALVYQTSIPASTKVGEAHSHFRSVVDFAPRSPGAVAYRDLTREIVHHGETGVERNGGHGVGDVATDGPAGRSARRARRAAG